MVTLTWLTTATIHLVQIYLDENSLSKENQPESFVQLTKPTFCLYSIHAIGNGDIEGVTSAQFIEKSGVFRKCETFSIAFETL